MLDLRRRDFITLLGGAAAWPLAARAQQRERIRSVGILNTLAADDMDAMARVGAFIQGLRELGWVDRHNVQIETRWATGDADVRKRFAAELVAGQGMKIAQLGMRMLAPPASPLRQGASPPQREETRKRRNLSAGASSPSAGESFFN
jgi:hypothetical protein